MVLPDGYTLPSTQSGRKSYKSLKHLIKTLVNDGQLVAHEQLPPIRSLCERFEISLVTVQRALSELCDENVLYAERGRGTFVAPVHRVCQRIGILCGREISTMQDSIFNPIIQVIQGYALESGKSVTLTQLKKKTSGQFISADLQDVMRLECDVIILVNIVNLGLIASLRSLGTPIIAADLDATDVGVHSVYFDNEASAFDMTSKLIEDGHKDIWFFGNLEHSSPRYDMCLRQRQVGYRLACRAHGIAEGPSIYTRVSSSRAGMKEQIEAALSEGRRPSAIVTESTSFALNIFDELHISVEAATWSSVEGVHKLPRAIKYVAACDFKEVGHKCWCIINQFDEHKDNGLVSLAIPQEIQTNGFKR